FTYSSPGGGVRFVGRDDKPFIERWKVDGNGKLNKEAELGLDAYGVTSTYGRSLQVIQFIDDERAYYVDIENFQVIVFNPQTMKISDDFTIDGLDAPGEWDQVAAVRRDGDRLLVAARYYDEVDDTTSHLSRVAIIDVTSDAVQYAEDTRCGNLAFDVIDDDGNIYFGSHAGLAVSAAAGIDGDSPPPACI